MRAPGQVDVRPAIAVAVEDRDPAARVVGVVAAVGLGEPGGHRLIDVARGIVAATRAQRPDGQGRDRATYPDKEQHHERDADLAGPIGGAVRGPPERACAGW